MKKAKNECVGCFIFKKIQNFRTRACIIVESNLKEQCPCQNCLIKVSCKNRCPEYRKLRKDAFYILFPPPGLR